MVKKKHPNLFLNAQVAANCQKPTPENDVRVLKLDLDRETIETSSSSCSNNQKAKNNHSIHGTGIFTYIFVG